MKFSQKTWQCYIGECPDQPFAALPDLLRLIFVISVSQDLF